MLDLRDSFIQALAAHLEAGNGLALAAVSWRCCPGAVARGPGACTCWAPVYDRDQADPHPETVIALVLGEMDPPVRKRMCGDCAYRPGSPERSGHEAYACDPAKLEELAATGRFWCHDGMRQPVAWRHPAGLEIPDRHDGNYDPPIMENIPFRADGTPGLLCAGWDARRRALAARSGQPVATHG